MKYPEHTISQSLNKAKAKKIAAAIEEGKTITNPRYEAAIKRILASNFEDKNVPDSRSKKR